MITEYHDQLQIVPLSLDEEVVEHMICVCVRKRPINAKGEEERSESHGSSQTRSHCSHCRVSVVRAVKVLEISAVLICKNCIRRWLCILPIRTANMSSYLSTIFFLLYFVFSLYYILISLLTSLTTERTKKEVDVITTPDSATTVVSVCCSSRYHTHNTMQCTSICILHPLVLYVYLSTLLG